jgi:Rod binding domain-containing protein
MQPAPATAVGAPDQRVHQMHPKPVDPRAHAVDVARQFEQVFVQMMVQNLRQSANVTGDDNGGLFGSGPGSDTYTQWFDDKLGSAIAKDGHTGIADVLVKEFERWHQIPKAPPAAHPALPPTLTRRGLDVAA